MTDLPPVRCDDESTWRHKGERIDLPRLLELIEENGGPEGLDLHGCVMRGVDAGPEALRSHVEAYAEGHGTDAEPPWVRREAEVGGGINLDGAHLQDAELTFAHLEGANLLGAHLENAALFGAYLEGANLREAHLEHAKLMAAHLEHAEVMAAHLEGANLLGAHLQHADLLFAHLEGANLMDAHLEEARLEDAHLESADLSYAHLENADLRHTHLENADLGEAGLDGAFWHGCYLDRTRIRRESLGRAIGDELKAHKETIKRYAPSAYRQASEAYLLLKNHLNSIGRYEDASWAYIKEQQMEKMAYHWEWRLHGWRIWSAWGPLWRWLRNWLYELTTGYGERPWNPVIIGAVSILAFAFGYLASGGVAGFSDALIYSLATFATFNLARPEVQPQGTGMEMASSLEALLGIGILALFVYTLGNRMSRS